MSTSNPLRFAKGRGRMSKTSCVPIQQPKAPIYHGRYWNFGSRNPAAASSLGPAHVKGHVFRRRRVWPFILSESANSGSIRMPRATARLPRAPADAIDDNAVQDLGQHGAISVNAVILIVSYASIARIHCCHNLKRVGRHLMRHAFRTLARCSPAFSTLISRPTTPLPTRRTALPTSLTLRPSRRPLAPTRLPVTLTSPPPPPSPSPSTSKFVCDLTEGQLEQ